MSNPTRQEILDAHAALAHLTNCNIACTNTRAAKEEVYESEKLIRKFLRPIPRTTMAEVEWDDDEHYLAEACHEDYGKVIMLGPYEHGLIDILFPPYHAKRSLAVERETLTLTGKRYMLTEMQGMSWLVHQRQSTRNGDQ